MTTPPLADYLSSGRCNHAQYERLTAALPARSKLGGSTSIVGPGCVKIAVDCCRGAWLMVSPEKPASVPPRDAVFLLPTGETWDIAESNAGGAL